VQTGEDDLSAADQELLTWVAEGKPMKAIAVARHTTPEAVSDAVEHLFLVLAKGASTGTDSALRRLRMLHQAIVDREEQGETLSRLLPGGLAERLRDGGHEIGESEELEVTVLMSDIRSYSSIAERVTPTQLAAQLNEHRAAMNHAIIGARGTVMQFVGDAVMAVFGAPFPQPDHADRALAAALAMHRSQHDLNQAWEGTSREEFLLGIGLSTGKAAAALLGSEERLEYTLVGDTVNLAQRLQEMARPGGQTILSEATWEGLSERPTAARQAAELVKGRATPVVTYRVEREIWSTE
jgi:class 3 adenylate cyclase